MISAARANARERLDLLLASGSTPLDAADLAKAPKLTNRTFSDGYLAKLLYFSGVSVSVSTLFATCTALACGSALLASLVFPGFLVPLVFIAGFSLPLSLLQQRADKRATEFAADYGTVLLAAASSLKTGMTAQLALERAVRLLPQDALVRHEVEGLLQALRKGLPRELALGQFASSISLPDLALFRSAFLLVLENGGRFAPTLERLSRVSKDRTALIGAARVTTATMRMTATILLLMTPCLLFVISIRSDDFWDLMLNHPTANALASTGVLFIAAGYLLLRKMSNFKP